MVCIPVQTPSLSSRIREYNYGSQGGESLGRSFEGQSATVLWEGWVFPLYWVCVMAGIKLGFASSDTKTLSTCPKEGDERNKE